MPIAIKDSKIDITSEKLTKELAKEFTNILKVVSLFFYMERWELEKLPLLNIL
jgi:hypothetical protein